VWFATAEITYDEEKSPIELAEERVSGLHFVFVVMKLWLFLLAS
jgi:hypothetical protein